jgi:hypothetical protein
VATDKARGVLHGCVDLIAGLVIAHVAIYWPVVALNWLNGAFPAGESAGAVVIRVVTLGFLFCVWGIGAVLGCMVAAYLFGAFPPFRDKGTASPSTTQTPQQPMPAAQEGSG